jgi:hypothetical protein
MDGGEARVRSKTAGLEREIAEMKRKVEPGTGRGGT